MSLHLSSHLPSHRLDPLLRPHSIAVVGASAQAGAVGNEVLVNLRKGGYRGQVYAVNPRPKVIEGVACFATLSELPLVPQHVVFAVGDARLEACLEEAIALGVQAATIFSALHLHDDLSPPLRERIRDKAAAAGMLLHGGNCMGFFNVVDGVFVSGFDTRSHIPGGVVLLSQSGAGMAGIVDCEERLRFCFAASTGQELCVGMEDYLDFVLDLPATRVVGLFLETSRQPVKFVAALEKARRLRIPIVAIKVGKSALAAALTVSHSGAMAGSDASYQAVFDRYGVQRVDDMAQLATALILFSQPTPVAAGGLVALHDSGGERQLAIDLAQQLAVPFTQLSAHTVTQLEQKLDAGLPAVNPLDAWGSGGAGAQQNMSDCFTLLLEDPQAALGVVVHDRGPDGRIYPAYLEYLRRAQAATGKPVVLLANHEGSASDPQVLQAMEEGIPVLAGLREFLVGVRCLLSHRDFLARPQTSLPPPIDAAVAEHWRARLHSGQRMGELAASELLRDFGLPMVVATAIESAAQLRALGKNLAFPLVLKTAAPGIVHKSDVGGVVLNLGNTQALLQAYATMANVLGPQALVAPMEQGEGVEMILGVSHDEQFGPMVLLGMGGVFTETLRDVVVLPAPFAAADARRALDTLRMRALLDGLRGSGPLAIDAYCEMAARLSVMAVAMADCIAEVDINPVRVMSDRCIGLDAVVVSRQSA